MQRRAAAVYGAIFLVLALGSYGMIAAASAPTVSVANPDYRVADGGEFTVGGTAYTASASGGSGSISWTVPEADYDTTWEAGDQVLFQGTNYTVNIPDGDDPQTVELTEYRPVPDGVETTEVNGTEYAVVEAEDGDRELVPLEEFLTDTYGPAETRTLEEGRTYDYQGNRTSVEVEPESATLAWTAPAQAEERLSEGDQIELGGTTYVAHYPDDSTLVLDADVDAYEEEVAVVDKYHERVNGLWGVSILSGLGALLLLSLSYLPSRY